MSKRQKRLAHRAARKYVQPQPVPQPVKAQLADPFTDLIGYLETRYEQSWPKDAIREPFPVSHVVGGGLPELGRSGKHGRPVKKH